MSFLKVMPVLSAGNSENKVGLSAGLFGVEQAKIITTTTNGFTGIFSIAKRYSAEARSVRRIKKLNIKNIGSQLLLLK